MRVANRERVEAAIDPGRSIRSGSARLPKPALSNQQVLGELEPAVPESDDQVHTEAALAYGVVAGAVIWALLFLLIALA